MPGGRELGGCQRRERAGGADPQAVGVCFQCGPAKLHKVDQPCQCRLRLGKQPSPTRKPRIAGTPGRQIIPAPGAADLGDGIQVHQAAPLRNRSDGMQYKCHHTGIVGDLPDMVVNRDRHPRREGQIQIRHRSGLVRRTNSAAGELHPTAKRRAKIPVRAPDREAKRQGRGGVDGLPYEGFRSVVALGGGLEWSGWDATVRFCVSVETDF